MNPCIETERLCLRPLGLEDAAAVFAYRSDPQRMRFQSWVPETEAEVQEWIRRMAHTAFDTPETWFQLAVRERSSDQLVGDLGVHFFPAGSEQFEFGVSLSPDYQRKGYAREAIEGLLDDLFQNRNKRRVIASVDPRNQASLNLMKRLGLRQEGHERESLWFKGEWVDDVRFGLLAREWHQRSRVHPPPETGKF